MRRAHGQASLELLAAVPALLLAALIAFQLLVTVYTLHLADGAAEAGALALAGGADPEPAVRGALPGWAREAASVAVAGGRVEVVVRPPAPVPAVSHALQVTSDAWAEPADG